MKNENLKSVWNDQANSISIDDSHAFLRKAKEVERKQKIGVIVMVTTVTILIIYAIAYFPTQWNWFATGLCLMIGSLAIRVIIELISKQKKLSKAVSLNAKSYVKYLQGYYRGRKTIHYVITPLCFGIYVFGLIQLFPYFKQAFSAGFYNYLVISGIVSLAVIAIIIIVQIRKEMLFLKGIQSA
ncbi:hypothetical protein [Nonlabens ponticola]|uniref:Uncharacterized protein n=1 Tax=Nonlabens ponticola TaxID=2496866 RepID=A0A3S9MVN8_9FLAO|nr:hypothetical protein [Nonlabens ponticola]AZQ43197.1 hypothetical protein EJ995_02715 [Nonlabens ponticola]